jgi:hypothetical protein
VGNSKATNSRKRAKRRYIHSDLDEGLRIASKRNGKSEMAIMKAIGMKLKKKKKRKAEWRFDFRI